MTAIPFELRTSRTGDAHVVALAGELDMATAPKLARAVEDACANAARAVTVDLAEVSFIDSTGLRAVLEARDHCTAAGRRFFLIQTLSAPARRIFEIAGIDTSQLGPPEPAADPDDAGLTRA